MHKKWLDRQTTGLVVGILVPLIVSFLVYYFRFSGLEDYGTFISTLLAIKSLGKLLSISVVPNLLFFFLGIWSERLLAARGVLIATIFYGLVVAVLFLIQ